MNVSRRSLAVLSFGICAMAMSAAQASAPAKHPAAARVAVHHAAPAPQFTIAPQPYPTCGPPVNVVKGWLGRMFPQFSHPCPV